MVTIDSRVDGNKEDDSAVFILGTMVGGCGSVACAGKFQIYKSFIFDDWKHFKIDYRSRFARGKVFINNVEDFKERII